MEHTQTNGLISVVVPVYNIRRYLSACVDSILAQSYRNFEIILVDDGSTDGSGAICDAYRDRHENIVVIHKNNGGLSDARNVGIQAARGALLSLVDGDDIIHPRCLELLYNAMAQSGVAISICGIRRLYDGREPRFLQRPMDDAQAQPQRFSVKQALTEMLYERKFSISASGKLYKAELFEGITYPIGELFEDLATTYKLIAKAEEVAFIPCNLYGYRQRSTSITHVPFHYKMMDIIPACNALCAFVDQHCRECKKAATYRKVKTATMVLEKIATCAKPRDHRDIVREMQKIIRTDLRGVLCTPHVRFDQKIKILCAACGLTALKLAYVVSEKVYYVYNVYFSAG